MDSERICEVLARERESTILNGFEVPIKEVESTTTKKRICTIEMDDKKLMKKLKQNIGSPN